MSKTPSTDAIKVASGGSLVLVASLGDRGLRLVITWLLSGALGPDVFGVYTFAITIATIVAAFGPLGVDSGMIYFGARFRQSKSWNKLRGLFESGALVSIVSAIGCALGLHLCAPLISPEDPESISIVAIGTGLWIPLLTMTGLLRAYKDMRGYALSFHGMMPIAMLIGALAVYIGLGGLELALHSFWLGVGMATTVSIVSSLPKLRVVYQKSTQASYEFGTLMRYSVPLSLTSMLFRLNLWMDIIMLGFLSDSSQVGIYKITSALAMLAGIPVSALASIFNPIISEHIERKDLIGLNTLLKTVTRWLIIISIPVLLAMLLLTELVLLPFDPAYMAGEPALIILLIGQISWISCAPAMRIVPMSGHSMLNLASSSVAALLNIGLNVWLIPQYGAIGAALATASTLFSWSIWRLVEVWWISKCFPFDRHTLLLMVISTLITLGLVWTGHDSSLTLNILSALFVLGSFYSYALFRLLEPSDMAIGQHIKAKLLQKFSRNSGKG